MKSYARVLWMPVVMGAFLAANATAADPKAKDAPTKETQAKADPRGVAAPSNSTYWIEHGIKDLNLTDAQKAKVSEICKAAAAKEREAVIKNHEDARKAYKSVIDEDQLKKLEKILATPGIPAGFSGPVSPDALMNYVLKDLNLTDAQRDKVKAIHTAEGEKAGDAYRKMFNDAMKAIKDVIDEEQFKKLDASIPRLSVKYFQAWPEPSDKSKPLMK